MTFRFVPLVQGSAAWKDFRKGKIGSSMAASIMKVGFKTPLQLFEDIMEDKECPVTPAMLRGTILEPEARAWLNDKYKCNLEPVVVQHPNESFDWHISSIDGFCKREDGSIFVVEIKCAGREDHQTALDGKVPEKYIPQLLHILEDLPGVDRILYFSYREDSQAEVWVERDEYYMAIQFAEELAFYSKLLNCTPPDPTVADWVEFHDHDLLTKAAEYSILIDELAHLQERAMLLKQLMVEEIGLVSRAKIGDLRLQKVIRKAAPQYAKIPELQNVDLDKYRGEPVVSWRIG